MRYDLESIIVELENEIFTQGKKSLLNSSTISVNVNNVSQIISRLREAIPPTVMEASNIVKDRDRLYADAHADIEKMMNEAEQYAKACVDESNILTEAKRQAEKIKSDAYKYADEYETEAKRRLDGILARLEKSSYEAFAIINNSRKELNFKEKE